MLISSVFLQACAMCINIKVNDNAKASCPLILKERLGLSRYKSPCSSVDSKDVLKYWGQPDSIERTGSDKECWIYYKSTYRWYGILFFIIVPIPILFPVGKDKVSLIIENGYVTEAVDHGTRSLTVGYYFVPGHGTLLGYESNPNIISEYYDNAIAKSKVFISTTPTNSEVRLKDSDISFKQGMLIDSGKHSIEISAPGYWPRMFEINLMPWETKKIKINLNGEAKTNPQKISNLFGMNFVYVKPGTFLMGSQENEIGRNEDESLHKVTLSSGYYIQTTEVTRNQCIAIDKAYTELTGGIASEYDPIDKAVDKPKEASWMEVQEIIHKLNVLEGAELYRLPTEAEWEYACRSGSNTRFHWGDLSDCSNANCAKSYAIECCDCEGDKKYSGDECFAPSSSAQDQILIAKYPPNSWGILDMHGNVFEWCNDWYGEYPKNTVVDPKGPSIGKCRVVRGGDMKSRFAACRSASRSCYGIDYGIKAGFRLVREVSIKSTPTKQ